MDGRFGALVVRGIENIQTALDAATSLNCLRVSMEK
jgi:hypothetical protein